MKFTTEEKILIAIVLLMSIPTLILTLIAALNGS